MVLECYVLHCPTNSQKTKGNGLGSPKPTYFRVPKDPNLRQRWEQCYQRPDRPMKDSDFFCSRHFLEEDIIKEWTTQLPNGDTLTLERKVPILKPNAVPCFLLDTFVPRVVARHHDNSKQTVNGKVVADSEASSIGIIEEFNSSGNTRVPEVEFIKCEVTYDSNSRYSSDKYDDEELQIWDFLAEAKDVKLPSSQWCYYLFPFDNTVVFMCIDYWRNNTKKMVKFTNSFEPKVFVNACDRERYTLIPPPKCSEEVVDYLKKVDKLVICEGVGFPECMYSSRCMGILLFDARRGRCECCRAERRRLLRKCKVEARKKKKIEVKNLEYNVLLRREQVLEDEIITLKQNIMILKDECAAKKERTRRHEQMLKMSTGDADSGMQPVQGGSQEDGEVAENSFQQTTEAAEYNMAPGQIVLAADNSTESQVVVAEDGTEQHSIILTGECIDQPGVIIAGEEMEVAGEEILVIVDSEEMILDSNCLVVDENCEFIVQDATVPMVELPIS